MSEILGENFDPIAEMIDQADFDDDDRDTGTSGLCGTFALALHVVLKAQHIASTFVFFSPKDQNGQPQLDQQGYPFWSHVAVKANGKLYDIDGHVLESHCISNYCWDHKHGGVAVPVDSHKASSVILATKNAFDQKHFDDWRDRLSKGKR